MAGIPVGKRFDVESSGRVELTFRCAACGYQSPVTARAEGAGHGVSWFFVGQNAAKERATTEATEAVREHAQRLVAVAACPACQKYDSAARRQNLLTALVGGAGTFLGCCALAALFRSEWFMLLVMPIVGLVAGGRFTLSRLALPGEALRRLSFHQPPPPSQNPQQPASLWKGPE